MAACTQHHLLHIQARLQHVKQELKSTPLTPADGAAAAQQEGRHTYLLGCRARGERPPGRLLGWGQAASAASTTEAGAEVKTEAG